MKIAGVPKSDKNSASCRIRFYAFLNAMPPEITWHHYRENSEYDILYVQKVTKEYAKKAAKQAYKKGIPIVYDMDDVRKDWASKKYDNIISYAQIVTTDTMERAKVIREFTDKPVMVVPDCIDYGINRQVAYRVNCKPSIVTFGHKSTVQYALPYLSYVPHVSHICNEKIKGLGKFYRWKRETFLNTLQEFDVAFLAHKNDWQSDCKSINRLLVCMAMGIPTIVSDSLAYKEAMIEVGHPELCVKSKDGIYPLLEKLKDVVYRNEIGDDFIVYADKYKPENSAKKLIEVFNEAARIKRSV